MSDAYIFAGLEAPASADTPALRRLWLQEASDDALYEAVEAMLDALAPQARHHVERIAELAHAPVTEIAASPFSLRAVALGVAHGARCVPHELRLLIPFEAVDEAVQDPDHNVWDRGVLMTGKYQSFQHDDPFLCRNPNHMSRWTAHEMLHRAGGFAADDTMSNWELYIGARLNELVPVVHWYGTDSFLRLRKDAFVSADEARTRTIDRGDVLWLTDRSAVDEARIRAALPLLRATAAHFDAEMADISREMATGGTVECVRPMEGAKLNASSDAIAYVVGHEQRLRARNVQAVLRQLPEIQAYRYDSIPAYYEAVEALFDVLLFGTIEVKPVEIARSRMERQRWDYLLRAAHHPSTRHGRLHRVLTKVVAEELYAREVLARLLTEELGEDAAAFALSNGEQWTSAARAQLVDGLHSFAPVFATTLEERGELTSLLERFVDSDFFERRAPLDARLSSFLEKHDQTRAYADLLRFEAALARASVPDASVEHLGLDVDEEIPHDALLTRSRAFAVVSFSRDILTWFDALGERSDAPAPPRLDAPIHLLIGVFRDDVQVVPAPRGVLALLDTIAEMPMRVDAALAFLEEGVLSVAGMATEWPDDASNWLIDLLAAGVVSARPSMNSMA